MVELKKPVVILIAEDDDDYYALFKEALEQFHLINSVRRVADGEELMDYLLHCGKFKNGADAPKPGLIFLDINMPKKSGLEALKEVKTYPELCRIPVVMLTISRDQKDISRSYALGACSFITKPLGFHQLVEALRVFQQYWFEIVTLPAD